MKKSLRKNILRGAAMEKIKLADSLQAAGPMEAAKQANANVDIRSGGMARIQGPNGPEYVKNPQLEKQQMPDGSTRYVHISPDPLPRIASGKILKRQLRDEATVRLGLAGD